MEDMMMKITAKTLFTVLMLLLASTTVQAGKVVINDAAALGDMKTGKGVFLVDIGDAKKLNFYLKVIQGTYKGMKDPDVSHLKTPHFWAAAKAT
jgi:hypothetical protein